jgi:hypothetical protein
MKHLLLNFGPMGYAHCSFHYTFPLEGLGIEEAFVVRWTFMERDVGRVLD